MSDKKEFSSHEIEAAIERAGASFTLASVARDLGAPRSEVLRRRLEQAIERDDRFFFDDKWSCRTRENFFNGRSFLITPDDWEIAEGMLLPGHRFVPFIPESVFPSEVELREAGGKAAATRKITAPLGKIFHYHLLLGSEQIFDFLLAEDQANESLRRSAGSGDPVTLAVFDLADFYKKNDFAFGDALKVTVLDYAAGKLEFSALSAAGRKESRRAARIAALDKAMKIVWEKFQDYLDIPEQLAWAEFFSGDEAAADGASLDEYITSSEWVELRPEGDHAVLSLRAADTENDEAVELPEGLSISTNDLGDPMKILSGAGCPLSAAELDGFMLDAIHGRETDIDGVFARIFGHKELDLADEAQQAVLTNFLEERFEELLDNYNRVDDEPKAELRSQLLEAVSDRLDYLAFLGSLDREISESEHRTMHALADVAVKLGEALKLLNNPAFTPDQRELDKLAEMIDDRLDRQEELLGDFRSGNDSRNE